jgi:hypothetical protein
MTDYDDIRDEWVPEGANVILETIEDQERYVVFAWDGHLNVLRFYIIGVQEGVANWVVSHDYCEHADDIEELT